MNGIKMDFPLAAFLTAALYLNAFFYQMGVVAFYGYPNISGYLSVSYALEGFVPCLLFYIFSFFFYLALSFVKTRAKFLFYPLMSLPAIIFLYWIYQVNDFEKSIGVYRISEKLSLFFLLISFYSSMLGFSGLRNSKKDDLRFKLTMSILTLFTMVFSGSSIGRMTSYYIGDIYKIEGQENAYLLKAYTDRLVIATCDKSKISYSLESDFSKFKLVKLQDDKEKDRFRACLFKFQKDISF